MYRFQANASWFEIIFNTAGNKETKLVCRLSKVVSTARPQPFVRSLSKKLCAAKRGKRKCSSSSLWIRRVEERRRERVEERKQRQQAIVLSLLVVRLPAVTSPLFTPTPEQLSRAFLFRHHFDIHCATDSPFRAVKGIYRPILWRCTVKRSIIFLFVPS